MDVRLSRKELDILIKMCQGNWHGLSAAQALETARLRKKLERALRGISRSSAKSKGMVFQREIGRDIAGILGVDFGMGDEALVSSRLSGQHGTDIILRGRAREMFPFDVECKALAASLPYSAWEQAKENSGSSDDRDPLLIYRKTGGDTLAVLAWEVFKGYLGELYEARCLF